jgi:hypothetical protein
VEVRVDRGAPVGHLGDRRDASPARAEDFILTLAETERFELS